MSAFQEAALEYLAGGLHPIPCAPREKRPLVAWKAFQSTAPSEQQVRAWWRDRPDANVALVLGRGTFAVDLDGGWLAAQLLGQRGVLLPENAPRSRTGTGFHFYLSADTPVPDIVGLLTTDGGKPQVDIRGVGIVVAPPSIHPNGARYEWEVPLAGRPPHGPLPLMDLIGKHGAPARPVDAGSGRHWATEALRGVAKGHRDEACTRLAGYFLANGLAPELVEALLIDSFARNCDPPFDPRQVHKCVTSIARRAGSSRALSLTPFADFFSQPEVPMEWVVADRIARGSVNLFVAKPKVGKSTTLRDLVVRVARGEPWLGHHTRQGTVWAFFLEEQADAIRAQFRTFGARGDEPVQLFIGRSPNDLIDQLALLASQTPPDLIVVDPLQRALKASDINDYAETTTLFEPLIALARTTRAALVFSHHAGKQQVGIDGVLGSTALAGSVDNLFILARTDEYRTLKTIQRLGPDLEETILAFDGTGRLTLAGTKRETELRSVAEQIAVALPSDGPGLTEAELEPLIEGRTIAKRAALRRLVQAGNAIRTGKGGKSDPFRYSRSCSPVPPISREQERPFVEASG